METTIVDEEMHEPECSDFFSVYRLKESEERYGTLIQAQRASSEIEANPHDTFNILMGDVSGSMCTAWPHVSKAWNDCIKDKLTGTTKLFKFDDKVTFMRNDTYLTEIDQKRGGGTNITSALKQLRHEVDNCTESFVRVFIITDGQHGEGYPYPEEEINLMRVPTGKTVNVYLLGISSQFPVNYSIDIHSNLHNGSSNMPSLYWAKNSSDIAEEIIAISHDLKIGNTKFSLNYEGYILPGLDSTTLLHLGEWLYLPKPLELMTDLKVTVASKELEMPKVIKEADVNTLLDHLYPQWNTVLIQQHRKKLPVPKETFDFMDSLFRTNFNELKKKCENVEGSKVKDRLMRKKIRNCEVKYTTLMNMSKSVIEVEGKYENEIELANNILKSTVSGRKYDTKNLKIRGHGLDDFDHDNAEFRKIYKKIQGEIKALPPPHPEECCRITILSTLSDLQDEDFLLMLDEGKFELLRNFTMTGIPAYAPVRDASQINVWTLTITHMLVTPFTILSQRAIEEKLKVDCFANDLGFTDRDVQMVPDDEKSRFNIIIPIVPAAASKVLKPIVQSNLYAMLATFCILKNPHIIDYSAHIAALACAWVRSIADHPSVTRPEYVTDRLTAIVATAELYMDRKGIKNYLEAIKTAPRQALMTESKEVFNEQILKCESLVKPLFFVGLRKDQITQSQLQMLLPVMLGEFVGRCLSNYNHETKDNGTPFTDFFAINLKDPKKKEEWLTKATQNITSEFTATHRNLLKDFFTPEELQASINKFINNKREVLDDEIKYNDVEVNMNKVKHLRNVASCGDVRFYTFKAWAQEVGIPEEEIKAAYDPSMISVYVCEALKFRNSKDRLSREPYTYDECVKEIKIQVRKEYGKSLVEDLKKKISESIMNLWKEEYLSIHKPVVIPLTPEQIVSEAQARDIQVTLETFSQKYKYNAESKLVRNACLIPGCPFYLVPDRRFNQHLAVERIQGEFPHSLHLVSKEMCNKSVDEVVDELIEGTHTGRHGRKKCPISETQQLLKLTTEIKELLLIYKQDVTGTLL